MGGKTLLAVDAPHSRREMAAAFRAFADELASDQPVTFETFGESLSIDIPETAAFDVEVEREREDGGTEYEIEFEIEWLESAIVDEHDETDGSEETEEGVKTGHEGVETGHEGVEADHEESGGHEQDDVAGESATADGDTVGRRY